MSSPSLTSTSTPLNLLQRLPAEVRHMIYAHLTIPIGTYAWLDCLGPPHCRTTSHIIFHEDAKWPMTWHALPGVFQIRRKMENIVMIGAMHTMRVQYDMNGIKLWATVKMDNGLLGVNREVRNEVLSLMVGGVTVCFEYALHNEMVGRSSLATYFTYLTSVNLDSKRFGYVPSLGLITNSVLFLAKHSPRLRSLTCICPQSSSWSGGGQMEFTQACQVLTMSSTELQVLCIKGVEAKRGRVVVNKSLHKEEFDGVVQWVSESMTGME